MTWRRALIFAILVYVGLDLSSPAVPGAFVFDTDGSVESAGGTRTRQPTTIVALPTPVKASVVRSPQSSGDVGPALPRHGEIIRHRRPVVSCLPRASCARPPLSEDPH